MTDQASSDGEFKRGWPVVLASMIGIGLGLSPLPFYTTGIFAPHLAKTFGWTMGQVMAGISVTSLMVLWAGPVAGILADRLGVRRVALTSAVLFSLAFMSLGLMNGSLVLYYVTWALVAIFGAGTLPITWTRTVNARFDRHKGLALGISMMGTGLFGILCKPLTAGLIGAFGWRGAYVGLGLLPLLITVPVAFFLFRDGYAQTAAQRAAKPIEPGLTFVQTLKEWRFWLLALAVLPISFALAGPLPNMENILNKAGFTGAQVLELTPFIGLSALVGRLAGGWLLDKFWAPGVALFILMLPGVSCWVLAQQGLTYWPALASILLLGFAVGVEYDLIAFMVVRYFGMRSYASIYGVIYVFFALGAGLGPTVFGWSFDKTGSYSTILAISFLALALSALALLGLGRYRRFEAVAAA